MELLAVNHSSYPRIGASASEQALRRTTAQRDRGEKTDADVRAAEDALVLLALQDQERAGADIVTDGLIRWGDPISYLAAKLEGARINGLHRYLDTNFYFRRPVVDRKLKRTRALVVDEIQWAGQRSTRPVKAVLTGPFTLAHLSLYEGEIAGWAPLARFYAEALSAEVAALAAAGVRVIQVDEPALLKHTEQLPLARESLGLLAARKGNSELALALYFGDVTPLYARFQELPVDSLILDFTYSPGLPRVIEAEGSAKSLGFGLLDGRNTQLEDKSVVARQLERMLTRVSARRSYLTTSCGIEYLPRDRAQAKLRHLTAIKESLLGAGS
jgi:5-methyltetrahydropteroyltriglutamate--homocysteine methyltransferase